MAAAQTLRLAHRGDHRGAPENSIAALLAAMDVPGCDGVEFDVRASADGVPVLVHDETLARVQGRREAVGELTAARARRRLGVPRLDAALAGPAAAGVPRRRAQGGLRARADRGPRRGSRAGPPERRRLGVRAGDHRPDPRSRPGLAVLAQHPPPDRCHDPPGHRAWLRRDLRRGRRDHGPRLPGSRRGRPRGRGLDGDPAAGRIAASPSSGRSRSASKARR